MDWHDTLKDQLVIDEGKRNIYYPDTKGKWTIGVGHNLADKPLSDRAIFVILDDDVRDAELDARKIFRCFDDLSDNRKCAVVNLSFNMGYRTLSIFNQFIALMEAGEFARAADDLLQTAYARQVGDRAKRVAELIRGG